MNWYLLCRFDDEVVCEVEYWFLCNCEGVLDKVGCVVFLDWMKCLFEYVCVYMCVFVLYWQVGEVL